MNALRRDIVLDILHRHKVEFAERYGVTKLGIFGSVARDDAAADSDVDIVFETETPNLFRTTRMKQELIDVEEVYNICRDDIPLLIVTVRRMIHDLDHSN